MRVFRETWLATYPNEEAGITLEDIDDFTRERFSGGRAATLQKELEHPSDPTETILVAKENNAVVGAIRIIRRDNKNQLQAIYVLPDHQGKGIGSKLWEAAQNSLDKDKETYVEVANYNQSAIDFYHRLGFVDTGRKIADERFKMKSGAIINEIELKLKKNNGLSAS